MAAPKLAKARSTGRKLEGIELVSRAKLPTVFGDFIIYGFLQQEGNKEHTALVHGTVKGRSDCTVRIHSECHTGDIWGSLRCDCRQQLEASLQYVQEQECGVVIYLRQEGRGIGLLNKLRAYDLQDQGLDTVEANQQLGLPTDARTYEAAAAIIRLLGIRSVALMTNNPDKIRGLTEAKIQISRRIPLVIRSNAYNRDYLLTKRERLGHMLD